jgi:hypothetical protein
MRSNSEVSKLTCALPLLLMLTGCSDHLDRRDTIAVSAGNSKAANAAIHTIDPWPRHAFARSQPTDGQRAAQMMQNYRGTEKAEPAAAPAAATTK